ncbi:RHS repeat domain-containing protein, partial [Chitinophaga silvisoli]
NFEGEFSSGTADEFTTLFVDQTSADPGTESGISYGIVAKGYRYGFNGKENDNEVKGEGNEQDYGMRIYDPRVAKFLSIDPLTSHYSYYSPYQFAGNKPIMFVDIDGLEIGIPNINKFKYGDNIALNVISVIDNGGINILNLGIDLVNTATYVGDNIFHPSVIANQTKSEFQELAKNVKETAKSTYTYHTQTPWKQQVKDVGYQLASAEQWEVASTFAVGMAIGKMDFSVPELPAGRPRLVKAGFSLGSEEGAAENAGKITFQLDKEITSLKGFNFNEVLDQAPANKILTFDERLKLSENIRLILKTINDRPEAGLRAFMNAQSKLGRMRFLDQVPEARDALNKTLIKYGQEIPDYSQSVRVNSLKNKK